MKFRGAHISSSCIAFIAASLAPSIALAQTEPQDTNTGPGLGDIVVTAQKRSERLQDVPISITAVTGAQLATREIRNTQDLALIHPGLVYNQLGGFAQPFLRGIGTDVSSPNVDPSVATYIDGAFIADSQSTITNLLGVERVEVLAGPQGTLYGRNAVAGAINIITLTPKQEFDAAISVSAGTHGNYTASAHASGGVTDRLAAGWYLAYTQSNTIYNNRIFVPTEPRRNRAFGARMKAVWDPTDFIKFTGSVEIGRNRSPDLSAFRQGLPTSWAIVQGATPPTVKYHYLQSSFPQRNVSNQTNAFLKTEIDLGGPSLVGVTNYHRSHTYEGNDHDASNLNIYGSNADIWNKTFSQELQIVSEQGSALEYVVGAYYFKQDAREQVRQRPEFVLGPGIGALSDSTVANQSYSAFAQATYSPIEKFRITLGGRYTHERKRLHNFFTALVNDPVSVQPGDQDDFLASAPVIPGTFQAYPSAAKSWSKFTPKVTLDYRMGGTMVYATYSKGFKSGAYDMITPNQDPLDPEQLTSYEVGSKSDFLNGRLRVNLTYYHYDFKDIQTQVVLLAQPVYKNAATATADGIEGAITGAVTSELTLTAQGAWQKSKYDKFQGFPAQLVDPVQGHVSVPTDVSGNRLQRAPKWVASAQADWKHELESGATISAHADVYYNGGFYWNPNNDYRQKAYTLVNGSISYQFPDKRLQISAYGKNIFNKAYEQQVLPILFSLLVADSPPSEFGVRLGYKF